ncbi:hypothetical protein BD770DRAFT_398774 [Pilaira anomala]|nr:hypothetical protein BD770DRAFT_398774 [Pilaira anomala]
MLKYLFIWYSLFILTVFSTITQPLEGDTWTVGQTITFSIAPGRQSETVNIFVDHDRSIVLGGGSIENGLTIQFTVPANSVNPNGGPTTVIAVHRVNFYLDSVESVDVNVVY